MDLSIHWRDYDLSIYLLFVWLHSVVLGYNELKHVIEAVNKKSETLNFDQNKGCGFKLIEIAVLSLTTCT